MIGHGANRAYLPLPVETVCVCPDCAWKWIEFLAQDPRKEFAAHEAEAITIMNKEAIITCPRRREAMEEVNKYLSASPSPRTSIVKKNIFAMLCEKFLENQALILCAQRQISAGGQTCEVIMSHNARKVGQRTDGQIQRRASL